jgi:hypothetical protein
MLNSVVFTFAGKSQILSFIYHKLHMAEEMNTMGELVISPSFLVRATGKNPRAILHSSSTDIGVSQRILDDLEANKEGYSYNTVKDIA